MSSIRKPFRKKKGEPLVMSNSPLIFPKAGGEGRIRTFEGISRQIYSLMRLATSLPPRPRCIVCYRTVFVNSHSIFGDTYKGTCPQTSGALQIPLITKWSRRRDLNPRQADYKSATLPTELRRPIVFQRVSTC
jgi:hypothetical protein